MPNLRTSDNDFTIDEIVEYERKFVEPFHEIFDSEKPQIEKVAYVAYMKARRDDEDLDFDEFIDNLPFDITKIAALAFGEFRPQTPGEEGEEFQWDTDLLRKEQAIRMARFCQGLAMSPSEYKNLTYIEQQAFIDVLEERNKAMSRKRKG